MDADILVPFRLELPNDDSVRLSGIRSVSYQVDGLLGVDDAALTFEWVARRKVDTVGFTGVQSETDESPVGHAEVPLEVISSVRLRGWWWAPRLEIRARELDAFDAIPTAHGSVLTLRLRNHDRHSGAAAVRAIQASVASLSLPPSRRGQIGDGRQAP